MWRLQLLLQPSRRFSAFIAVGVREILGLDIGASEEEGFWTPFLRRLADRGLKGVELVTSDAHGGLQQAIATVLTGAGWQRCRVHFMCNVLAHVPKRDRSIVVAAIHTLFAQPNQEAAGQQLAQVVGAIEPRWPKAAEVVDRGENEVLTYMAFPPEHWSRIYSTNPLERLNREVYKLRSHLAAGSGHIGCPLDIHAPGQSTLRLAAIYIGEGGGVHDHRGLNLAGERGEAGFVRYVQLTEGSVEGVGRLVDIHSKDVVTPGHILE